MANKAGGWSETKFAEIQKICDQAKDQVEEITHEIYWEFKAVAYREQVVAGMNYIIKIYVGNATYLHVLLFQALPCDGGQIKVLCVLEDKTKEELIEVIKC